MSSAFEQRTVRFFGRVQGVGFRYTACRVAGGFAVAGYVRNLSDGSVECVAEGDKPELDAFIDALRQRMADYVDRTTQQSAPATGQFKSFGLRY